MWKQHKCPNRELDKAYLVYVYMEYYLVKKKNKILSFAAAWMSLEDIILSEISQRKTDVR